jgi:hypothetical protein
VLAAAMTEAELQLKVTSGTGREPGLCAQLGLKWFHVHDSRRSPSGWPDLVIARHHVHGHPWGAVVFRELKAQAGKVTPAQEAWLEALTWAGLDAGVWRPSDLLSGRIARELAAVAGLAGGER